MIILTIFFFITAVLYSSIGFGGGSTYLALLLIWDVPYYIFPILALICNIIVVSGNSINFLKSKNINFNLLYPYLIGSIPLAFIGASISIEKNLFEILLNYNSSESKFSIFLYPCLTYGISNCTWDISYIQVINSGLYWNKTYMN